MRKTTGIVRRIDDLGRIVIPREIRKALNIIEGDSFEIFVEEGVVCFQPYYIEDVYEDTMKNLIGNLDDSYYEIKNVEEIKSKLREAIDLLKGGKT